MPPLTPTRLSEERRLIVGSFDLKQIPLVSATVETSSSFGILDQLEFARLDLQGIHIFLGIDLSGIEEEVVCGNAEQRLCEFSDARNEEVLNVLRRQHHRGVLLADALHAVADILNSGHVGEEQIQLVHRCHGVALAEELIAHEGQNVEQHRILEAFVAVHESFDSEAEEVAVGDIGVTVEILALRADAHGVDAEAYLLQSFLGIEIFPLLIVGHIFFLAQMIEVLHRGIVGGAELIIVGEVGDAESRIQLCEEDFDGVELTVVEFLIATEKVLEECDVL